MKFRSVIKPLVRMGLASLILAMVFNSCNTIWSGEEDCPQGLNLRFVYDYNMEYADAFNSQVHCVSVLVFDENGNYVTTVEEIGEALKDEDYRMKLELEPGNYTLVAYGGYACEDRSFNITPFVTKSASHINELYAEMEHNDFVSNDEKHDFFHGILNFSVEDNKMAEEKVFLVKNTNNIRIVLQQMNGETITPEEFTFTITDDNSYMNVENAVIPKGLVTYQPWASGQMSVGTAEDGETPITAAYAEFSTSRLTVGTAPKLVIRSVEKDEDIINIPLNNYLLLLKSDRYSEMGAQEFLDRESVWTMLFLLDSNNRWINTHIIVNGWIVRLNHVEM